MELLSGYIVFIFVNLATASPYGYGAKSGAVAKAEASASAGAFASLPVIPLATSGSPGYSGSFSKSSSSSFASSSASSSSSSSSYSYSGAGSNVIPGFGTHTIPGCGGNCQHNERNELGASNQVPKENSGTQGFNFAGASAGANTPGASNDVTTPCKGSYCNGSSGKKCTTNQCGETENKNGNSVAPLGNSQSDSDNRSNDYEVKIAGKPHSIGSEQTNKPYTYNNNGQFESSDGKISGENTKSSDCESPDCDSFVPHSPASNSNNLIYNKPSGHLETPYQEQACTTHDCNLGTPNSNSNPGKPSSYNVPILGNQQTETDTKENSACTSGNCQISNDYSSNKQYLMKPSSTLQVPIGPSEPSPCHKGECLNTNYHSAADQSTSYQPTGSAGPVLNPSHQPSGVFSSGVNPSGPATVSQSIGSGTNPSYQPTAPTGFDKSPVGPSGSAAVPGVPQAYPSYHPSQTVGTYNNPSYHPSQTVGTYNKPSYYTTVPSGSRINPSYEFSGTAGSSIRNTYNPNAFTDSETTSSSPLGSGNNPISQTDAEISPSASPSYHPSGITGSYNKPSYYPAIPAGSSPSHEPSGVASSGVIPSYNPTVETSVFGNSNNPSCTSGNCANPSSHSSGSPVSSEVHPNRPNTGFIPKPMCVSGNCANPSYLTSGPISSVPGHPNSAILNVKSPSYPQISTDNQNFHPTTSSSCETPNCHPATDSGSSYNKPIYSGSSIIENSKPSKTDSEVLLSNKGNQIYTGGFGGPTGVLSPNNGFNNKDKPSLSGIIVTSPHHSGTPLESQPQSVSLPNVPNYPYQEPAHINHQPTGSTNLHPMGSVKPNVGKGNSDDNKPQYTGGFGGPAGLLKPNEYTIPSNTPKSTCSSGNCDTTQVNQIGTGGLAIANAAAVASAKAVSYSGGFGGPPGLLKPYDEGKLDKKEHNIGNGHDIGTTNNLQPHSNGASAGSQGSAVASASATAGSYGHSSGGCNTGCSLHKTGHDLDQSGASGHSSSGFKDGNIANASATAQSVAGTSSYAQGRSVASASAHASAGAATKGGYTWK